jgi:type I restriction enzyme R subunit
MEHGVDPATIRDAKGFEREKLKEDAVAAIVVNDETRRRYMNLEGNVEKLFKSLLPDSSANEFGPIRKVFSVIAEKIRSEIPPADISGVMDEVAQLLDDSVATEGYVIRPPASAINLIDLSLIDFAALRMQFEKGRKTIEVQKLRGKVAQKLAHMIRMNPTRKDFQEEFQKMIDEYNSGAANVETFFANLMAFTKKLSEEEKRGISENLTEEELVIFDLLRKPDVKLTNAEERQVKKVAKILLDTLKKERMVLDWRKHQTTRAGVLYTIQRVLDEGLPRLYTPELYEQKCGVLYQHVFDSYQGLGKGLYAN